MLSILLKGTTVSAVNHKLLLLFSLSFTPQQSSEALKTQTFKTGFQCKLWLGVHTAVCFYESIVIYVYMQFKKTGRL